MEIEEEVKMGGRNTKKSRRLEWVRIRVGAIKYMLYNYEFFK